MGAYVTTFLALPLLHQCANGTTAVYYKKQHTPKELFQIQLLPSSPILFSHFLSSPLVSSSMRTHSGKMARKKGLARNGLGHCRKH